jgi:hypothetical protein
MRSSVAVIGIAAVHFRVNVVGSSMVNSYVTVPLSVRVKRSVRCRPSVDPLKLTLSVKLRAHDERVPLPAAA